MNETKKGMGFCGTLTLIFIVLKLIGVIDWGWLYVLSPILISFGIGLIIISTIFISTFFLQIVLWIADLKDWLRDKKYKI